MSSPYCCPMLESSTFLVGGRAFRYFAMKRLSSIIVFSLAWILWIQYESIGVGKSGYENAWEAHAAYPSEGYEKCIEDAETLARHDVSIYKDMDAAVDVRVLLGKKFAVNILLKDGGSMHHTYTCFPDTVKPG